MNWEAIGAAGEILGAAAVVVTLLYLALQVRHNTLATTSNTQQIHLDAWNAMSTLVIENVEVASLLSMSDDEVAALDRVQEIRLEWFATKVFAHWEHVYADILTGLLETAYGNAFERYYRDITRKPIFREFWESHRDWYFEEFVVHVDQMSAATSPTSVGTASEGSSVKN